MNSVDSYARLLKHPRFAELANINARAIDSRPFLRPDYVYNPISVHDKAFHQLLLKFPYFGPINISVANAAEFLTLSMNDDIVSKLYFFYGPDAYEPLSAAIWTALATDAPGAILDIGSYAGLFTLIARSVNAKSDCIAFEPVANIRARLQQNLVLNRMNASVKIEPFAVSDVTKMTSINVGGGLPHLDAGASLAMKPHKKTALGEVVQAITLDQYFGNAPDIEVSLMKLDVELHETEALSGASVTIDRTRPSILCEVAANHSFKDVQRFLEAKNYEIYVIDDASCTLIPANGLDIESKLRELPVVFNIIALPGQRETTLTLSARDRFHNYYPALEDRP